MTHKHEWLLDSMGFDTERYVCQSTGCPRPVKVKRAGRRTLYRKWN